MPLTDTAVRQAKPAEKDFTLKDGSGLSLLIAPNGIKSWHFWFSWHRKQPRMSLGTCPEITLKEARDGPIGMPLMKTATTVSGSPAGTLTVMRAL